MRCVASLCLMAIGVASAASRGLPVRSQVSDYAASAGSNGVTVAADVMDPDQIRGSFATDLSQYVVVEVAVYPNKDGSPLDVATIDFGLRADGRLIRPAEPASIARVNQRRGQARSRDVVLYPTVGMTTGSWGTGTQVGVGVGMGGGAPGPASTDRDRSVMERELEDKGLPEALAAKPVAGYLYFPVGSKRRATNYELEYTGERVDVKFNLPAPKVK